MEDLFELLVALLVIVVPLISKSKKKKQEKPGKKKAAPQKKAAANPDALKNTLTDVEKKINAWLETLDEEDKPAPQPKHRMEPQRLEAEKMEPEPLIPQSMASTPLEEIGMGEGQSRTDDAGCIGGSLSHDPQAHHQGMDFHPHGTHGRRAEEPMVVQRVKPAVSAAELRKAVLWKEILDQPVSMRD